MRSNGPRHQVALAYTRNRVRNRRRFYGSTLRRENQSVRPPSRRYTSKLTNIDNYWFATDILFYQFKESKTFSTRGFRSDSTSWPTKWVWAG
jgi:hypothetical protein